MKRDGVALGNIVPAGIGHANNLDRIETIRNDGRNDGRIDGADPGLAALTGRMAARFADSTLVNQAIAGTPCELTFAYTRFDGASLTLATLPLIGAILGQGEASVAGRGSP